VGQFWATVDTYEAWEPPTIVDFERFVGKDKWNQHWANWGLVQSSMREAQILATEINKIIAKEYQSEQT